MKDSSITLFDKRIGNRINFFDEKLKEKLSGYSNYLFYKPVMDAVLDGKRIRPLILLLSYEAVNGTIEDPFPSAIAVELVHAVSLIHDDMIDNSKIRREGLSFHELYGNNIALLSQDFILGIVLEIISKSKNGTVIAKELADLSFRMCEGELKEIKEHSQRFEWERYINIIEGKTAALFSVSAKLGAIIGNGDKEKVKALSQYGKLFGVAYQLVDDLIDWKSSEQTYRSQLSIKEQEEHYAKVMESVFEYTKAAKAELKILPENEVKQLLLELPTLLTNKIKKMHLSISASKISG